MLVVVRLLLLLSVLLSVSGRFALAETPELRLGTQRGLTYLPWAVIEHEHLIEAAATDAGLGPRPALLGRADDHSPGAAPRPIQAPFPAHANGGLFQPLHCCTAALLPLLHPVGD